jgi:hypothetical protein
MLPAPLASKHPDHLQLPDVRRPDRMPSLPEWVASRVASLKNETQPDRTGRWRQIPTIPSGLILKAAEREAIERYVAALDLQCAETPASSADVEAATLVAVTKMMMVLPSTTQNELSAEARGEAFMAALDDIPVWSTEAAIRRWYRGDCGSNERGRPYDYHWCPAPAELRRVAFAEMWRIKSRSQELRRLLCAEPRLEYSDEHCRRMRDRLTNLFPGFRTSPVGKDGSGEVTGNEPVKVPTVGRGQGTPRP